MRDQGYRTTAETVNGVVGVVSVDAAGAPAGFSMRGFSFSEVNVLYNGISTGPQSITSRTMDTADLAQASPHHLRRGEVAVRFHVFAPYCSWHGTTGAAAMRSKSRTGLYC